MFYLNSEIHYLAIETSLGKISIDGNDIKREITLSDRARTEACRFAYEGHLYILKYKDRYYYLSVDGQNIPQCRLSVDIFNKKFAVRFNESIHTIKVYYSWKKGLNIYCDNDIIYQNIYPNTGKDNVICSTQVGDLKLIIKEVGFFNKNLKILLDGVEIAVDDNKESLEDLKMEEKALGELLQVKSEENISEVTEIIGSEEFPLNNSFGGDSLNIEHELSKTTYNELKIDSIKELNGSANANLLFAIKAEISSRLSKQTGHVAGDSVTRRQTIKFSVKPHQSVTYVVLWKRKVRKGNYIMSTNGKQLSIPYQMDYELSYEIQSKQS